MNLSLKYVRVSALLLLIAINSIIVLSVPQYLQKENEVPTMSHKIEDTGPRYYIDKVYSSVFFADGSNNKSNEKPSMTKLWYLSSLSIDYIESKILDGFNIGGKFSMYDFLKSTEPPTSPSDAVEVLRDITIKEMERNIRPRGILIIMGHFSPKTYAAYQYDYITHDNNTSILFPESWAHKTSDARVIQVYISAGDIAEYTRKLKWKELPALILLLGCESTNSRSSEKNTWRWAFRFSKIGGDFPDYWIGRSLIGADTNLHAPYSTYWIWFIDELLFQLTDHAKEVDMMSAIKKAVEILNHNSGYINSKYKLIIKVEWVDDQGYGYEKYEIGNQHKEEVLHIFTYTNLYVDPPPIEEGKIEARQISLEWIRDYLRIHYPNLYNYLNRRGFVIENVENMWYDVYRGLHDFLSREAREHMVNTYIVSIKSENLEITLFVNVADKLVEQYSFKASLSENISSKLFGENLSRIWGDIGFWTEKIRGLGIDLVEEKSSSNIYHWSNNTRGFQIEIRYTAVIDNNPLAEFVVHHYNRSNPLVVSGIYPRTMYDLEKYHASINIAYYREDNDNVYVYYFTRLPNLYNELYKIRDRISSIRSGLNGSYTIQNIRRIVDKIMSGRNISSYNISSIEYMVTLYSEKLIPAYMVDGSIIVEGETYNYTIILFPDENKYFMNIYPYTGDCLCSGEIDHRADNGEEQVGDNGFNNTSGINNSVGGDYTAYTPLISVSAILSLILLLVVLLRYRR